jgi:hypothetical protein
MLNTYTNIKTLSWIDELCNKKDQIKPLTTISTLLAIEKPVLITYFSVDLYKYLQIFR